MENLERQQKNKNDKFNSSQHDPRYDGGYKWEKDLFLFYLQEKIKHGGHVTNKMGQIERVKKKRQTKKSTQTLAGFFPPFLEK
jgi:hypothetical protein